MNLRTSHYQTNKKDMLGAIAEILTLEGSFNTSYLESCQKESLLSGREPTNRLPGRAQAS